MVELVAVAAAGGRFQNFNSNAQSSWDDRDKHRGVECFKCNQDGHILKNCPYNNTQNTGKSDSSKLEGVALISSTINQSNEWFIDSAAKKHIKSNKRILENYVQYQEPRNIYVGNSTVRDPCPYMANGKSNSLQ